MTCTIPKDVYLRILDVCKKARLVAVQDTTVLIEFDRDELNDPNIIRILREIIKPYGQ